MEDTENCYFHTGIRSRGKKVKNELWKNLLGGANSWGIRTGSEGGRRGGVHTIRMVARRLPLGVLQLGKPTQRGLTFNELTKDS